MQAPLFCKEFNQNDLKRRKFYTENVREEDIRTYFDYLNREKVSSFYEKPRLENIKYKNASSTYNPYKKFIYNKLIKEKIANEINLTKYILNLVSIFKFSATDIDVYEDIPYINVLQQFKEKIIKNKRVKPDKETIIKNLSAISDELKHITDNDKKIKILINLNEFIKKNKEIIKKKCPDKLVSILNSL